MQQLEIQFFFPLTEQIPLDLDYTKSVETKLWQTMPIAAGGTTLTLLGDNGTLSWSHRIGDWEIQKQDTKPSKFQQWFMKKIFGMKWTGK